MTSEFNILLDKATSSLLLDVDWDSVLRIVDLIRQGDVNLKAAVQGIVNKLKDPNPNVVLLAVQLFESVLKNCGQAIHEQVATRQVMEQIQDALKNNNNDEVEKKLISMLATWAYAFRNEPKYRAVQDALNILKAKGYHFPSVLESDAMFTADSAPDWADGECCHRCRSQFNVIRRKHHCRACGQIFCGDCSNKYSTIPKFGIEREVRVCESCYEDLTNPHSTPSKVKTETEVSTSHTSVKTEHKKSETELKEEEELQLAIALSKSEAENKEKEKLRATTNLLGRQSFSPVESTQLLEEKEELDPELARYLDRSYWEKQQSHTPVKQIEPARISSPPILGSAAKLNKDGMSPLKTISKTYEAYQNGETDEIDEFVSTLQTQLEIFVNRMKSDQSRGRPIANDTAVQSFFMNLTNMHTQLLLYIQQQDQRRLYCEHLQDKITQVRDARAALDALREDHRDRIRREKEEQERLRQIQMMQKLEIMRKKKQEYLEYQRQLALHRMVESEREILSGRQQQKPVFNYPSQAYGPYAVPGYMYPVKESGDAPPPVQLLYQSLPPAVGAFQSTPMTTTTASLPGQFVPPAGVEYGSFNMSGLATNLPTVGTYGGPPVQNMQPAPMPGHGTAPHMPAVVGNPPSSSIDHHVPQQAASSIAQPQSPPEQQMELISFD